MRGSRSLITFSSLLRMTRTTMSKRRRRRRRNDQNAAKDTTERASLLHHSSACTRSQFVWTKIRSDLGSFLNAQKREGTDRMPKSARPPSRVGQHTLGGPEPGTLSSPGRSRSRSRFRFRGHDDDDDGHDDDLGQTCTKKKGAFFSNILYNRHGAPAVLSFLILLARHKASTLDR